MRKNKIGDVIIMMVKGKYGNYEWRNWTDKCVVGWRPIEKTT